MNELIKAIIVEDEPLAREGLQAYLREIQFIEVVALCEDALQANKVLAETRVDLMFLDVQMPKISGIEFLKSIAHPPMVIMTTAYPNFALQGYELDVIDYLVKPFPFDRLLKAVNKARDLHQLRHRATGDTVQGETYFFVKCDYRYEKIQFSEVLYVEAMENYVVIYTSQQKYVTLLRMKNMEEILPSQEFIRIHKSYIASIKSISAIDGNELIVAGKRLPLSREKKAEILDRLVRN
ncbi:MAG: response regulator transcription factor [Bacteroidia bacterium]|nr:response regulator transcription factor [Bacteroidia bacterium]